MRPSHATPNSEHDKACRRSAGWSAHMLPLRFTGVFLPARRLRLRAVLAGLIVTTEDSPGDFCVSIHPSDGDTRKLCHPLAQARVVKKRDDGATLLGGVEWDEGCLQQWPQTWLCGPSLAVVTAALNSMSPWLSERYTGRG